MESWVYLFSKFTHEALLFEAVIIFVAFGAYATFYITQKRKYGVAGNELPSNVVKAYLAQLMIDAEDMRVQLFGLLGRDSNQAAFRSASHSSVSMPPLPTENPAVALQLKELEEKMTEQSKALDSLVGDKKRLEEELAEAKAQAPASTAVTSSADHVADPALAEKLKTLEAQLAEYAIIEDDLANLKKLQKENKALRSQLEATSPPVELKTEIPPTEQVAPETMAANERKMVEDRAVEEQNQSIVASPPIAETTPTAELAAKLPENSELQAPSKDDGTNFESLINDVEKSLAQNAANGETPTNENKTEAQAKSEAELQADFEKMLNS